MARVVERFDRCVGCNPEYYSIIKQFAKDNQASLAAFEEHGVILKVSDEHKCPPARIRFGLVWFGLVWFGLVWFG